MEISLTEPSSLHVFESDLDERITSLYSNQNAIAVDTEAMGLIHGRDRLCLVQICDKDDNVSCIKIPQNKTNAPNLKKLMENSNIEKVFHFARFDVAALATNLGIKVNPLFCTKVGSKLARTYSSRHGLKEVITELVGVELDKQAQSSDWGKVEDLSKKQLAYAANDVRFLLKARDRLKEMLLREGRWELAEKCFKCVSVMSELDQMRFSNIFEH